MEEDPPSRPEEKWPGVVAEEEVNAEDMIEALVRGGDAVERVREDIANAARMTPGEKRRMSNDMERALVVRRRTMPTRAALFDAIGPVLSVFLPFLEVEDMPAFCYLNREFLYRELLTSIQTIHRLAVRKYNPILRLFGNVRHYRLCFGPIITTDAPRRSQAVLEFVRLWDAAARADATAIVYAGEIKTMTKREASDEEFISKFKTDANRQAIPFAAITGKSIFFNLKNREEVHEFVETVRQRFSAYCRQCTAVRLDSDFKFNGFELMTMAHHIDSPHAAIGILSEAAHKPFAHVNVNHFMDYIGRRPNIKAEFVNKCICMMARYADNTETIANIYYLTALCPWAHARIEEIMTYIERIMGNRLTNFDGPIAISRNSGTSDYYPLQYLTGVLMNPSLRIRCVQHLPRIMHFRGNYANVGYSLRSNCRMREFNVFLLRTYPDIPADVISSAFGLAVSETSRGPFENDSMYDALMIRRDVTIMSVKLAINRHGRRAFSERDGRRLKSGGSAQKYRDVEALLDRVERDRAAAPQQ